MTVLNNYKADVYEAWQLWLERDVVKKCICFSFSMCSLVFKLRVQSYTIAKLYSKICRFSPLQIQIGPPSDLHYKITPHSDTVAKVLRGGVLWP